MTKRSTSANQKFSASKVGASFENDPAKNAAADKIISTLLDGTNQFAAVPQDLLDAAGKALANRYCFALFSDPTEQRRLGRLVAVITPIKYFENEGTSSLRTGPIRHLLRDCSGVMESTWKVDLSGVETVVDTAKYLLNLGFTWNKNFQDVIQSELTKDLSAAIKSQGHTKKKISQYKLQP